MKHLIAAALAALLLAGQAHAQYYATVGSCMKAEEMKKKLADADYTRTDQGFQGADKWYIYRREDYHSPAKYVALKEDRKKPDTLCIIPLRDVGGGFRSFD